MFKNGNTMLEHSRLLKHLTNVELAWLAGFIDGDGCIGCRLKKRDDYKYGYQLLPFVSFIQKSRRGIYLFPYLYKLLNNMGAFRDRKDGVHCLEVEYRPELRALLISIQPYLLLKRKQAKYCLDIIDNYERAMADPKLFISLCKKADRMAALNDSKKRVNNTAAVLQVFKTKKLI